MLKRKEAHQSRDEPRIVVEVGLRAHVQDEFEQILEHLFAAVGAPPQADAALPQASRPDRVAVGEAAAARGQVPQQGPAPQEEDGSARGRLGAMRGRPRPPQAGFLPGRRALSPERTKQWVHLRLPHPDH